MSTTINFKPKQVSKRLIGALSPRSRDVMIKRYGLGKDPMPMTLDAIGKTYDITRERVRQIENHALTVIRKSKQYIDWLAICRSSSVRNIFHSEFNSP